MIIGRRDTIAAIATPAGRGGVGIIRISGPDAATIAGTVVNRSPDEFPDRRMMFASAVDADGRRLDDVLAVLMRAPNSYTGEDIAEIHGHGGTVNMARLLRVVLDAGARHAEAGEFTRRAFENGKLDLTRAEAVLDVIEASSERAWRLAQAQLEGGLGDEVRRFRGLATELLAAVEACIDFPEEGEEYLDDAAIADRAEKLAEELAALASTFSLGRALRQGIEIAIVGPVNSGKSSLFNRLLGKDRAIVDPEPGTTRDFVEATAVWDGIPVTFIDTAGDREAESRVERQGIERGRQRAAEADLVLRAHSASGQIPEPASAPGRRELPIVTKADLLDDGACGDVLATSAKTGQGIEELRERIVAMVCGVAESEDGHVVTSERQRALLDAAASRLRSASVACREKQPTEVVALEVREAAETLAEIEGERVGDEVLDELFGRFCIGK